jgi:hypothetical protein
MAKNKPEWTRFVTTGIIVYRTHMDGRQFSVWQVSTGEWQGEINDINSVTGKSRRDAEIAFGRTPHAVKADVLAWHAARPGPLAWSRGLRLGNRVWKVA